MTQFVIRSGIYSKKTDDVWLVLDPSKSSYLEMNDVASVIWSELHKPVTPEAIAMKITTLYDIAYDVALQDVHEFIQTYLKRKFLQQAE